MLKNYAPSSILHTLFLLNFCFISDYERFNFLYLGYGFVIWASHDSYINMNLSFVIYVILILNLVIIVDCNSFVSVRLPHCSVQPYFGNTRLMKIENAMSMHFYRCYIKKLIISSNESES